MRLMSVTEIYKADSEEEAKELIQRAYQKANPEGYELAIAEYEHKTKEYAGVVYEAWFVTLQKNYDPEIWD